MIGLDTNVLVRFFAQDDRNQCKRVDEFMQSLAPGNPGFVSLVVLAELVGSCFGATERKSPSSFNV